MSTSQRIRLEHLKTVEPITEAQHTVFSSFKENNNICMSGSAGTGKTFISLYLSLLDVMNKDTVYEKIIIIRSAVPTRDMGFLPGTQEEKEAAYTSTYQIIVNDLFSISEAWKNLIHSKTIQFMTTSYLRGMTFDNAIIIVDESQNCNYHELCSIITRVGNDSKLILCGDYYQSDFTRQSEKDGINSFMNILDHMKNFDIIEFGFKDIVRSGLVRDFIMTKELLEKKRL